MHIVGKGTVFITHEIETNSGKTSTRSGALHPVYHIPGLSARLLSVRSLLAGRLSLGGDKTKINFYSGQSIVMTLKPHMVGQTIYWLNVWHMTASNLVASSTVHEVNYDLMHCQFGHLSKDILRQASGNTKNFLSGISYPKNDPVCKGCAEGKMPSQAFPKSDSQATKPFEKIYMDLKSMPLCKNNSTCFGCLWCLWLSLSCFESIWLDVKIWKNAEKSLKYSKLLSRITQVIT